MSKQTNTQRIQSYLLNQMPEEERLAFEKEAAEDHDLAKHLNTYKQQSYCFFAHAEYGELSENSNNVKYIFEDVVRACLQLESKRHLSLEYVAVGDEEEEKRNEEAKADK